MTYHALVVDDSPDVLDDVKDRLESISHSCDCVTSLQAARDHLAKHSYSYILLDLEIPVRYGRPSRIQNGQNLLQEVRQTKGYEDAPIIVMTSHGNDSPDLAIEVLRGNGAIDYVKKPFADNGYTLEKAIQDGLTASGRARPGAAKRSGATREEPPHPFECGEMVFFEDRVELCEVKICGDSEGGMSRRILDALRQTNTHGRYVRYAGADLAKRVGCERGQNGIAEAVRDFRDQVCMVMLAEANIKMDRLHDIILNDRRYGYCLSAKITTRDAVDPANEPLNANRDLENERQNDVVNGGDDADNNDRQQWALDQMRTGVEFRKADMIRQFKCSNTTAERDLRDLRRRGLIEFVGPAKTGYWRLVR